MTNIHADEIEKVAREICQTIADDETSYWVGMTIEQFVEENWRFYTAEARAAILAAEPYIRAREREEIRRIVQTAWLTSNCDAEYGEAICNEIVEAIRKRGEGEG